MAILIPLLVLPVLFSIQGTAAVRENLYFQSLPINNYLLFEMGVLNANCDDATQLHGVISKLLMKHKVDPHKVDLPPLSQTLRGKLRAMRQQFRSCSGGRKRDGLKKKWKDSEYVMKFGYKTNTPTKRKLESCLESEQKRRKGAEEKLGKAKKGLIKLTRENEELQKSLNRGKLTDKRNYKRSGPYSESHHRREKKRRLKFIKDTVNGLSDQFYKPINLTLENDDGKEVVVVIDDSNDSQRDAPSSGSTSLSESQMVENMIFVRDTENISRRAYHEMGQRIKSLPREHTIAQRKKEINDLFEINEVDGSYVGVWQSLKSRLTDQLHVFTATTSESERQHVMKDGRVRVKISGDGTKIGKRMHVTIFTFTIIGEEYCKGYQGNYLLAIVKVPEKQTDIKKALPSLIQEIETLKTVLIDGNEVAVDFFLGGDMKFLNAIMGVQSFNAKYCCLWCKCPSELRFDMSQEWSMNDAQKGARTVEEMTGFAVSRGKSVQFGCAAAPLFSVIPVIRVVPDTLHLFLRIADQLMGHLLVELKTRDNLAKKSRGAFNIEKHPNIHRFEVFIQSLGIEWMFCVDKGSNMITCRDFTGPELWKIMTKINLAEMLPEHPKLNKIEQLWESFLSLVVDLKGEITGEDLVAFRQSVKAWLHLFCEIYLTKDVTPYMHVLVCHVPESLQMYGNLSLFNQQGLEKLNDRVTLWFFRSTQHIGVTAYRQIMEKQNRINYLRKTCMRNGVQMMCSKCKQKGHNVRTCNY